MMLFQAALILGQDRLVIDKVIAKVGSETVLLSDVEAQYAYSVQQQRTAPSKALKCQVLQSLIGQKVIVHHAKLDSVEVTAEELENQLDLRIDAVLRQMNGDEAFFREYYGMTTKEMRENLREDMRQQILSQRMQSKLLEEVVITPKEVKAFFNAIPPDSLPYLNAEVEVAEIVIKPKVNEEERIKALEKIIDIRKRIVDDGEDFAALAQKFSDDPGSGGRGGDLGFASRGTFVTDFEAAAYSLEKNEISDPIETEFGFHIIQMLERRGNRIRLRHILIKPDITDIDKALAKQSLDTLKAQIEKGDITFSEAVKKYSIEDVPSYHNNGIMQNPNTGKTFFQTSELSPEVYFAIEEMEVGDISDPLEYPFPSGETYYRIIKLLSKTKPHRANLEEDYTKILQYAKESKKNVYFASWLEEKFKDTFIKIDEDYLVCPDLDEYIN